MATPADLPWAELIHDIPSELFDHGVELARDRGIKLAWSDQKRIARLAKNRATQLVAIEVIRPTRAIIKVLTADQDSTPEELRDRILSSPLWSPANAWRVAYMALHGDR
jgi:hypothetical protein